MPNHATYDDSLEELGGVDPSSQIPLLSYPARGGSPPPSSSGIVGSASHESLLGVDHSATTSLSPGEVFTSSQEDISEGNAALYAALPLNTRTSIRVLDLDESKDGPVTGQLRVVDLDEHPFFTALSYVWGEYSEPKDTISCNGQQIEVTKNCLSALRHLRGFGPLTIWVDSICINQDDVHEKSVQIPLMGTLYSSTGAQAVYVWLGEGTKDTDAAMDYFGKGGLPFDFLISKNPRDGQTWENGIPTGNSMALRLGLHLYFRSITIRLWPHYYGIQDLLSRPWVERLWTLQEALLSDKVIIVCGKKAIPLQALAYSVEYMEFFRWCSIGVRFPRDLLRWQRLISIWKVFFGKDIVNSQQDRTLYQELELHEKYLQRGWLFFKILLGAQLALFFLLSAGIVVFPHLAKKSSATLTLFWVIRIAWFFTWPSLIPFAISIGAVRFRFYPYKPSESLFIEIHGRKSLYPKDKFYATYSLLRSDYDTPDYSTSGVKLVYRLNVRGIAVGRISWSSGWIKSISDTASEEELLDSMKAFLEAFRHVKDAPYSEFPSIRTSAKIDELSRLAAERQDYEGLRNIRFRWRMTMVSGIRKGPEWTLEQFQRAHKWSFLWNWDTRLRQWVDEAAKLLPKRVRTPFDFHVDLANYFSSEHMALGVCEGPYSEASVIPRSAREGDVVALIAGVSMPMILREDGDGYNVIGPSFFKGAMDGVVWEKLGSGDLDDILLT
ncbi:hypothetical protein Hte_008816 [Hypoxylon texense]